MPIPLKPCDGRLADDLQPILTRNHNRAQWANYTCEACGAEVGVVFAGGKWVPEQHWPSVKYAPRATSSRPAASRYAPTRQDDLAGRDAAS